MQRQGEEIGLDHMAWPCCSLLWPTLRAFCSLRHSCTALMSHMQLGPIRYSGPAAHGSAAPSGVVCHYNTTILQRLPPTLYGT